MIYDSALTLSVTHLKKQGALGDGVKSEGVTTFTRDGEVTAKIAFKTDMTLRQPTLTLDYLANGVPITRVIMLERVESNLGWGHYYFFICPVTLKRARKLFCFNDKFLHREAYIGCRYFIQTQSMDKKWFVRYHKAREAEQRKGDLWYRPIYAGRPTRTAKRIDKQMSWMEATLEPRINNLLSRY